ncbi:heat shock factor protein 4-like isoform X2 [Crotalus tigris]|uniref:heat shock factor protein 4-like isoform X2 n=1 Tax=Crotalus tigris TaxID=88082 RepID=UPI00192F66B4|nr:heat shock factor protein 4-like isoform X2 [Crotalus tigris]
MASFVRQLNMYGFRKVVNIEQGGLVKPERDDTEFQHLYFLQGHEHLLELIKRKVSVVKSEETKMRQEDLSRLLYEIQVLRNQQEMMECQVQDVKQQNEVLWKEVLCLRQNHLQHQKVINKLIQFLFGQLQPSPSSPGIKRKRPLMLDDGNSAPQVTKFRRSLPLDPFHEPCYIQPPSADHASCLNGPVLKGAIISDVSEATQPSPVALQLPPDSERETSLLLIKEEASGPDRKAAFTSPAVPLVGYNPCPEPPVLPITVVQSVLDGRTRCDDLQPMCLQPQERRSFLDRTVIPDLWDGADLNLEGFQIFLRNQQYNVETTRSLEAFNPVIPSSEWTLNDVEADLPGAADAHCGTTGEEHK